MSAPTAMLLTQLHPRRRVTPLQDRRLRSGVEPLLAKALPGGSCPVMHGLRPLTGHRC